MKAIINGKIILKDGIIENHALLFSNVIEKICPTEEIPSDCDIIDAEGGYIAPGLIDLHIHGFHGRDVCDGDESAIRTMAKGLIKCGVTGFLPTTMTVDMKTIRQALDVCRKLKNESMSWHGSAILGCHAEGPFINPSKKGAQSEDHILPPDAEFVKEYADIIRIITIAPETDKDNFSFIREVSRKTDVHVSIGHSDADYDTAKAAINAGADHITHLFNAMSTLSHRAPGVVGAALGSDAYCELIVDNFHVNKGLYDIVWKLKGRKLCFISDCLAAGGLEEGEYTLGGEKIIYKDNICRLEDGTIAGSVLKLNCGVWNVYKNSNIPLYECVNCASLNPAASIGISDRKGSLEVGKDADIIITDPDFEVKKTVISGDVRYEA